MVKIVSQTDRFLDRGVSIYDLNDEFLVVCPKCDSMAKVVPREINSEKLNNRLFAPRRLVCSNCTYRADWNGKQIATGGNYDWYFRLPLWLQISCCGETLWAYNLTHLEIIERYAAAKLRERTAKGRNSFLSKLPTWLKLAKNRDEILKAIAKIKEKSNGKARAS